MNKIGNICFVGFFLQLETEVLKELNMNMNIFLRKKQFFENYQRF